MRVFLQSSKSLLGHKLFVAIIRRKFLHIQVDICYELNGVPSRKDVLRVLTPSASECDLIWRQDLYRSNQVKMRSLGWVLIHMTDVLIKRGDLDRDTQKEHHVQAKEHLKLPEAAREE